MPHSSAPSPKPLAATDFGGWQVLQDGAIAKATDFGEQILSQDGTIARDHLPLVGFSGHFVCEVCRGNIIMHAAFWRVTFN